jgi:tetratricopeptide (TPR) repeat protein
MNSWHSWSPNGRWLIFSSKENTVYTQLFLTHINDAGRTTPPLCLSHFTQKDMAANIPEFVNAPPDAIDELREDFITPHDLVMAGKYNLNDDAHACAIDAFHLALERDPGCVDAYINLGNTHKKLSDFEEAEKYYRKAIAIDPQSTEAYHELGDLLTRRKDFEAARKIFQEVLSLDPEHWKTHAALGMLLTDMGDIEAGQSHIERAIALDPDRGIYHAMLGSIHLRRKEYDQAKQRYREALRRDPDCLPALMSMSTLLARLLPAEKRDLDKALELAEHACRVREHRDPITLISLSEIQAEAGLFQQALGTLKTALPLAQAAGNVDMVRAIEMRMHHFRNGRTID